MRYINKILSPAFIRDWCLKCCRHLKATQDMFNTDKGKTGSKITGVSRPKIMARHVLEQMYLDEREFLSLMCNALDRH